MSPGLVLDEMFSPEIASGLVKRGHDVVAVAADPALIGLRDEQILEWATAQGRCLVTENIKDFEILRRAATARGRAHAGLVYTSTQRFPRSRRYTGAIIAALERMIASEQVPGPDEVGWLT